MNHESWLIPPLTYPRRGGQCPESIPIVFNFLGASPWEELHHQRMNFHPPWTLYRSSLRSLDKALVKIMPCPLMSMLAMHGNSTICLSAMKYLGATSGAKTSVLCHYFWGRLDSFFTVALINHLACMLGQQGFSIKLTTDQHPLMP